MKTEDDKLIDLISDELYQRIGEDSIFSPPWAPQVVLVVLAAQGITDNGGFIYFFEGDFPGDPPYSVFADAFRAIRADESADCIEVATSLFPFPEPHLHGDERRDYLREHCMIDGRTNDNSTLVKLGDRVIDNSKTNYALLAQYIRNHLTEIRGFESIGHISLTPWLQPGAETLLQTHPSRAQRGEQGERIGHIPDHF